MMEYIFLDSPLNIENPLVLGSGLGTSPGQATVPGGFLARFRSILSLSVPAWPNLRRN